MFPSNLCAFLLSCCKVNITKSIIGTYSTSFGIILLVGKLGGGKIATIPVVGEFSKKSLGMLIFTLILYIIYLVVRTKNALNRAREKSDRTNTIFEALGIAMDIGLWF